VTAYKKLSTRQRKKSRSREPLFLIVTVGVIVVITLAAVCFAHPAMSLESYRSMHQPRRVVDHVFRTHIPIFHPLLAGLRPVALLLHHMRYQLLSLFLYPLYFKVIQYLFRYHYTQYLLYHLVVHVAFSFYNMILPLFTIPSHHFSIYPYLEKFYIYAKPVQPMASC